MNQIEQSIADEMANQIKEEIDREILFDMLEQFGWTRIVLSSKWLPVSGIELHEWRVKNLTGHYKAHDNVWMFEKSQDALIFSLRWA